MSAQYVSLTELFRCSLFLFLTMFIYLLLLLLASPAFTESIRNTNTSCIETERQALLSLKRGITDHKDGLSSWRSEDKDCCSWVGIHCSLETGHITALDLSPKIMEKVNNEERTFSLRGEIGPSLLNLTYLSYLDLSENRFRGFPSFIGSLNALRYLILRCSFDGEVIFPPQLGNLSKLEYLDFGCSYPDVIIDSPESISRLSSLRYLQMTGQNLSSPSNLFQSIMNLPSLVNIGFKHCIISIPSFPSNFSASKFLEVINIIGGELTPAVFIRWLNVSQKLVDLTVRYSASSLQDSVLDFIGSMTSLEHLDLSSNDLEGEIPMSWGNLCKLLTLDLSRNNLNGTLNLFQNRTRCPDGYVLREFRAAGNQLSGPFDFTKFESLEVLDVSGNRLNGSLSDDIWKLINLSVLNISENAFYGILPENIGKLSNLTVLDVHSNFLGGVISDSHISKLQRLKTLDLCFNSFKINLTSKFVPPFQLNILGLCSCKCGPKFPNWIRTQENLVHLDISNSGISDVAPSWLWDICDKLKFFNISHNEVRGTTPNFSSGENIDLSNNLFEGSLPRFSSEANFLRLSANKFSGNIVKLLCNEQLHQLHILDLSNNLLSGVLPDCWTSYGLIILDLSNNDFQGTIPGSLGILPVLISLRLSNNSLVGKLPSSFRSQKLIALGLGDNQLSGRIPTWLGSLTELVVLELQSNKFSGIIPTTLCQMKRIQILDLSLNNLSGAIPTCLNNLSIMTQKTTQLRPTSLGLGIRIGYMPLEYYIFNAWVTWKGKRVEYQKLLGLLKLLDFSSNKLSGEIPPQLASLYGLISLNLSSNELTGPIPAMIGQLQELDALDLSNNQLSGKIPESISNISRLTNLDLSNNHLSGRIPSTAQMLTFNATSFEGNPGLCGLQLKNKCPNDGNLDIPNGSADNSNQEDDQPWSKSPWLYGSVVLGFAIGFWGVCGPLVLFARFRLAYFQFLDRVKDYLLLAIALRMAKWKRGLQS